METYNLDEAARFLHMSPSALRQKAKAGEIPGSKPAKRWVFLRADLVAYLREKAKAVAAAAKRSAGNLVCLSTNGAGSGGFESRRRMVSEYEDRLRLRIAKKPKSFMTN